MGGKGLKGKIVNLHEQNFAANNFFVAFVQTTINPAACIQYNDRCPPSVFSKCLTGLNNDKLRFNSIV